MYAVHWITAEGRQMVDLFVLPSSKLVSTSYIHKCDNPEASAKSFVQRLKSDEIIIERIR